MKTKLLLVLALLAGCASAQVIPGSAGGATSVITGQIQTATSGSIDNGTLTFSLSQPAIVSNTATIATQQVACYTSTSGNIVGVPDPIVLPLTSTNTVTGALPAGTYYVKIYYVGANGLSVISPEATVVLSAQGTLIVNAPLLQPTSAQGYGVAISATKNGETIQGTVTGWGQYKQATALITGAIPSTVNTSTCNIYFSDQLVPTGTYYTVNLINKRGTQISGYPQTWCTYGGSNAVINVSQGAPTGNCNTTGVFYPTPIFSNLANGAQQSINTPIALNGPVTIPGGSTSASQSIVNAGSFALGSGHYYLESLIGGCDPGVEYAVPSGNNAWQTEAITGCLTIPPGASSQMQGAAVVGYVNSQSTTVADGIGVLGLVRSTVPNTSLHAIGADASDGGPGIPNNNYYGIETYMTVSSGNTASAPVGHLCEGNFVTQPTIGVCLDIGEPVGVAGAYWPYGIRFETGSTPNVTGNGAAILFNPVTSAVNQPSQGMLFVSNPASGPQASVIMEETAGGNLLVENTISGAGLLAPNFNSNATSNQLQFTGNTNSTIISIGNPAAPRTYSVVDPGANAKFGFTFNATNGAYQSVKNTAGCTTANTIGGVCGTVITVTWPTAFADTNYTVNCTPSGAPTNIPGAPYIVAKAAGTVTVNYFAITAAAASWASIDCEAVHD